MAKFGSDEKPDLVKKLKADLKNGSVGSFYVFYGEEAYLREQYLKQLSDALLDGPAADFNYRRFSAENLSPEALSDAVESMPMMAERTLIRVDDVDFFKLNEVLREQYQAIFSDLPDWCCLVLVYDTVEYKPNKTMKKLAEAFGRAQAVEFRRQTDHDLKAWIVRHFSAHGKQITDTLCEQLIFMTDGSMSLLSSEIEKVAAYASGTEIRKSDIDAVVTPVLNAQTFDIADAIADGRFETALHKLQELFALQTEPLMILGAVGSQLRRLLYARAVLSAGKGQQALCELTGMKPFAAGPTMRAASKVTDRFCTRAVELCLETDEQIKRSYGDTQRLLELLVARLALEANHASV